MGFIVCQLGTQTYNGTYENQQAHHLKLKPRKVTEHTSANASHTSKAGGSANQP